MSDYQDIRLTIGGGAPNWMLYLLLALFCGALPLAVYQEAQSSSIRGTAARSIIVVNGREREVVADAHGGLYFIGDGGVLTPIARPLTHQSPQPNPGIEHLEPHQRIHP